MTHPRTDYGATGDPAPVTLLASLLATIGGADNPSSYVLHARNAEALAVIGRKCQRLEARGTSTEAAYRRRVDQWQAEAAEILAPYGVDPASVQAGGDPRGYCLKWRFPPDDKGRAPGNDFGDSNVWGV